MQAVGAQDNDSNDSGPPPLADSSSENDSPVRPDNVKNSVDDSGSNSSDSDTQHYFFCNGVEWAGSSGSSSSDQWQNSMPANAPKAKTYAPKNKAKMSAAELKRIKKAARAKRNRQ